MYQLSPPELYKWWHLSCGIKECNSHKIYHQCLSCMFNMIYQGYIRDDHYTFLPCQSSVMRYFMEMHLLLSSGKCSLSDQKCTTDFIQGRERERKMLYRIRKSSRRCNMAV